jgi:rhamnogalacturonan endolyase
VDHQEPAGITRRATLQAFGGVAAGAVLVGGASPAVAAPAAPSGAPPRVLIGGRPATVGSYAFPDQVPDLVLDSGLVKITFARDDVGVVTGWSNVSITATSVVVAGTELAHNLNGVAPRDPDRQHSFYIDASGGRTHMTVALSRCGPPRRPRTAP